MALCGPHTHLMPLYIDLTVDCSQRPEHLADPGVFDSLEVGAVESLTQ